MGATASVAAWSDKDVATQVKGFGEAFEGYAESIKKNGLDGPTLVGMQEEELSDWFEEIGVKKVHQRRLAQEFKSLHSAGAAAAEPEHKIDPPASLSSATVPAPTRGTRKRFTAFLSHFKRECGTEARLVHQYLQRILPPEDEVFIDSGEASS